jgi:uracil-DNA glycosylase family 4
MTAKVLPIIREYDPRAEGARCDLCPLKGNTVVPPKASALPPKLVFVGEAPGRKEEIHGVPFIGQTGSFLRGLCREVDIDFREAALQNSALCRSNIDKENEEASVCCAPRLLKELAALDPSIPIVTLGKSSTLSVLGVRSIMHARGFVWTAREIDPAPAWSKAKKAKLRGAPKWKELWLKAQIAEGRSKLAGRTVLPTVHPAFVLRSDTWLPILKLDLDRIARWVRGDLSRAQLLENGPYVVVSKRDDIRRELRKLSPVISVDVETGASKPGGKDGADPLRNRLLCVGISDGEHTVVIWPWRKTHAPLVNALFKRAKTIGMHNGYNFDQIVLERNGMPFAPIEDKLEDTLIAHHTFASHMPQRLSHVAGIFVDAGPWKVTFKQGTGGATEKGLPPEQLSGEELCLYNAADARIQAQVWLKLQADLESERAVYAVDKKNARLCRSLIINGIGVDLERRAALRAGIVEKEDELLAKMRALLKRVTFHPMQLAEVRKALFTTLRAPLSVADPTESGLPSTSQTTLERLKSSPTRAGRFADLLLQWRGAMKIRSTYIDSQILDKPSKKTPTVTRTHFNWRSYGASSGRYSSRLQSCPRAEYLKDKSIVLETRVREVYVARPSCKLVYFDLSQAEMRSAAFSSGDATFMQTCQGDIHSGNAKILFPSEAALIEAEPKGRGKPFRDVAKNAGFGVTYLAETQTVFEFLRSKGFDVHYKDVAVMMDRMHEAYAGYFSYVQRNVLAVGRDGFMRSLLTGRIRWLGWNAPPTEVANFPIQSMIADLMNERLPKIADALPPGARVVAQIHDAAIVETPDRHVERVKALISDVWAVPVIVPARGQYGGSLVLEEGARSFVMPIELKCKDRWSDL